MHQANSENPVLVGWEYAKNIFEKSKKNLIIK